MSWAQLVDENENRLWLSRGQRGLQPMIVWDNSKLHWFQLEVWIKCLSIGGREGSWRKNRNQTRALRGSEGAERQARNTARRSQILLLHCAAEYKECYCCCCVWNNPLLGYTKAATMLHKASCWARLLPISTAVLHMITSNWSPPGMTHDMATLKNCGFSCSKFCITDRNQKTSWAAHNIRHHIFKGEA